MRKSVMAAMVAVVVVAGAGMVMAQPGPGMGGPGGPGMGQDPHRRMQDMGPGGHGMMRGHDGHPGAGREGRPFSPRDFALLPRVEDKKLTPAEVQKFAEGMLLWMGNRTWKVVDVKEAADNKVAFALALPEGGVVARFEIDRKTGHVKRAG